MNFSNSNYWNTSVFSKHFWKHDLEVLWFMTSECWPVTGYFGRSVSCLRKNKFWFWYYIYPVRSANVRKHDHERKLWGSNADYEVFAGLENAAKLQKHYACLDSCSQCKAWRLIHSPDWRSLATHSWNRDSYGLGLPRWRGLIFRPAAFCNTW